MSNDLEKFLQQAAERLAQKSAGKGGAGKRVKPAPGQSSSGQSSSGGSASSTPPTSSPRSQQRRPPRVAAPEPPIILDDSYEQSGEPRRVSSLREAGPDPLSTIDTRPSLTDAFNQADHRVSDHVNQVFDHKISNLRAASESLGDAAAASAKLGPAEATSRKTLVDMLRSPGSLRAAFIASEIFKRPS